MNTEIILANPSDEQLWNAYAQQRATFTFVDDWRWRKVIERSYSLPCFWYLAKRGGQVVGTLALTKTRHPLLGTYLATAPFGNHGGFQYDDAEAAGALLQVATAACRRESAEYVLVRHVDPALLLPKEWQPWDIYAGFSLDIPCDPHQFILSDFGPSARGIRPALKKGMTICWGNYDVMDDFWLVINTSMRDLGSPYHSRQYLRNILHEYAHSTQLAVIKTKSGDLAGGALVFFDQNSAVLLHANIISRFSKLRAAEFLYFRIFEECYRRGINTIDMGRSLAGSGNECFKMKWRPRRYPLHYWYWRADRKAKSPGLTQDNSKFRLAIRTWQRLPLVTHKLLGPRLITGLL